MAALIALRLSGRFSVIVARPSATSYVIVSWGIRASRAVLCCGREPRRGVRAAAHRMLPVRTPHVRPGQAVPPVGPGGDGGTPGAGVPGVPAGPPRLGRRPGPMRAVWLDPAVS